VKTRTPPTTQEQALGDLSRIGAKVAALKQGWTNLKPTLTPEQQGVAYGWLQLAETNLGASLEIVQDLSDEACKELL
jgi:hypothetical protein